MLISRVIINIITIFILKLEAPIEQISLRSDAVLPGCYKFHTLHHLAKILQKNALICFVYRKLLSVILLFLINVASNFSTGCFLITC